MSAFFLCFSLTLFLVFCPYCAFRINEDTEEIFFVQGTLCRRAVAFAKDKTRDDKGSGSFSATTKSAYKGSSDRCHLQFWILKTGASDSVLNDTTNFGSGIMQK